MTWNEPVTALTDYLLAIVCLVCAARLWRAARVRLRLAAAAFAAIAAGALFGGAYHAVGGAALWKLTVYSLGLVGFFLVAAAAWPSRLLLAAAGIKLAFYSVWITSHDEFRYVIYDYGLAMVALLALSIRAGPCWRWIAAAVAVTAAGSAVQSSGFALHRHFNHNDLYHVIQMGAAWLFYRGFAAWPHAPDSASSR